MSGLSLNDAVKRMRQAKYQHQLTVFAKAKQTTDLYRNLPVIKIQSVKNKLLDNGYGYVRITQFQEHTTPDLLAKAIEGLYKQKRQTAERFRTGSAQRPGGLLDSVDRFQRHSLAIRWSSTPTAGR